MPNRTRTSLMRKIPLIDVGERMGVASALAAPDRLDSLVRSAYRRYTLPGVLFGDAVSSRWLSRTTNPYAAELEEIATLAGRRGAYLLNMSYEWACTSGAIADPTRGGNTLIRVLDWAFDGLGENLIAAKAASPAGELRQFHLAGLHRCPDRHGAGSLLRLHQPAAHAANRLRTARRLAGRQAQYPALKSSAARTPPAAGVRPVRDVRRGKGDAGDARSLPSRLLHAERRGRR